MTSKALRHAPQDGIKDCWACSIAGDDNLHTGRDYLPKALEGLRDVMEERAQCEVAELGENELICWCGHSLHYQDCPLDGDCHAVEVASEPQAGFCFQRYTLDADTIDARWYCVDANESDHWPKGGYWVDEARHDQGRASRCGHCGSTSMVQGADVVHDSDAY